MFAVKYLNSDGSCGSITPHCAGGPQQTLSSQPLQLWQPLKLALEWREIKSSSGIINNWVSIMVFDIFE